MTVLELLATLPSALGITGFIIYYFLLRTRQGDRITSDIVAKLRQNAPGALPSDKEIGPQNLAKIIENDSNLRSKISDQDFHLLKDALRQQFIGSIVVYVICALIFFAGILIYFYVVTRTPPLKISSISAQSANSLAHGVPVDLDQTLISWIASGPAEDVTVVIEDVNTHSRTRQKTTRSSEGKIELSPEELRPILKSRIYRTKNRVRIIIQGSSSSFVSNEFDIAVGITILAVRLEPYRVKIAGLVDNKIIDNYNFEAKLLIWAKRRGSEFTPITYGGNISPVSDNFKLDSTLNYDFSTAKLVYLGPDDSRIVRTELLGF